MATVARRPDVAQREDELERKLSNLASQWRGAKHEGNLQQARQTVEQYHAVFGELTALGWVNNLPPDAELPDALMPVQ